MSTGEFCTQLGFVVTLDSDSSNFSSSSFVEDMSHVYKASPPAIFLKALGTWKYLVRSTGITDSVFILLEIIGQYFGSTKTL